VLLPQVVRWNSSVAGPRYEELLRISSALHGSGDSSLLLATRLDELARAGGLPRSLSEVAVQKADLKMLADEAATQWTGRYNPRPFDAAGALEVYEWAY
jgi:alcohol dehydrogenase class IV